MEQLDAFEDALQRELAWRKLEISALRSTASRADDAAHHVFRSALVMLCAHWEGYLKKSANLYIEHVFSQNVKVRELSAAMIAVAYFEDVQIAALAKYPGSEENHIRLAQRIRDTFDERASRPRWLANTEGNPGSDTLERILKSIGSEVRLGMDDASWATTRVFINELLVRDRHHIAHGEGMRVSKSSFLERAQRALDLFDTLTDQLISCAQTKTYMPSP